MKKIGKALLVMAAGAMFPAAFFLLLAAALHILDETPMNYITLPIAFALLAGAGLIYRKLERHD